MTNEHSSILVLKVVTFNFVQPNVIFLVVCICCVGVCCECVGVCCGCVRSRNCFLVTVRA